MSKIKTPAVLPPIEGMVPNCPNCDALFQEVQPANVRLMCPVCKHTFCLTIGPEETEPESKPETPKDE